MSRKITFVILALFLVIPGIGYAGLENDQQGGAFLIENSIEVLYISPVDAQKYSLIEPDDALNLMQSQGLGMNHAALLEYLDFGFPADLSGMIVLDVEASGEAYYVYTENLEGYYLGSPEEALIVFRERAISIAEEDSVAIVATSNSTDSEAVQNLKLETVVFRAINEHRKSIGVPELEWSEVIAEEVRAHSTNIASGEIAPSHEGFLDRIDEIKSQIDDYNGGAENIAFNLTDEPAETALDLWLQSPSHRASLENNLYDMTGIGVSQSDGIFVITQIFINID